MNIHHINFVVHDLDNAVRTYQKLGLGPFKYDELPARGALTARAALGEAWLVLVQPTDDASIPGRHLDQHGEGFFLLSLGVGDLSASMAALADNGVRFTADQPRAGLLDWQVIDIDPAQTSGVQLQLASDSNSCRSPLAGD